MILKLSKKTILIFKLEKKFDAKNTGSIVSSSCIRLAGVYLKVCVEGKRIKNWAQHFSSLFFFGGGREL